MKAVIRVSPSSYETGDVVTLVQDDHIFSSADLPSGQRTVVDVGDLTIEEQNLYVMLDEAFINFNAVNKIPAFRHGLFKRDNMKIKRRKKYKIGTDNKPEKKIDLA